MTFKPLKTSTRIWLTVGLFVLGLYPSLTFAQSGIRSNPIHLAQLDDSDAYDPFVDYSEFEGSSDEEADINFFKNGRFFTLGMTLGQRMMTSELQEVYSDSPTFGLFLSYFFDLRFALQLGFVSGSSHTIDLTGPSSGTPFTGSSTISSLNLGLKYYFNTQNVTKGLAQFNPYIIGGLTHVTRKTSVTDVPITEDTATGVEAGAGIEFPLLRKKMYLGLQTTYQFVNFSDENQELRSINDEPLGVRPAGDFINVMAVIGVNF